MSLQRLPVGLLVIAGFGCGSPETQPPERYVMSDVHHVLVEHGRRTGEVTADSMAVGSGGTVAVAWNVAVELEQGPVIRADSMTVDWSKHEMRYHGRVEIPTLPRNVELRDLTLYKW